MPRVLIVAATTGYQTHMFADAARRIGMDFTLATDRCHILYDPWGDHAIPVRFDDPHAAVAPIAAAGPFDGVVAIGDKPAYVAAVVAEKLGLRYHSPAAVETSRNKFLTRRRFQAVGLPVPRFFRMPLASDPGAASPEFPCVLKPLCLSASRGVIRANNLDEFVAAFRRIRALLTRPQIQAQHEEQDHYVQVESFIPGREFAVEGVMTAGKLKTLAVFEKPDPLDGPFFEETIYLTPPRSLPSQLITATEQAVRALGLRYGPIHAEMRYDGSRVSVLEVAARPIGGLCAQSLRFGAGMPLEELLLHHAVGEEISRLERESRASGVMMIPIAHAGIYEGVDGVEEAERVAGVEKIEITAKVGQALEPLPEGSSYLGFIFARGATSEDVDNSLRRAHASLQFQLASRLPVMR